MEGKAIGMLAAFAVIACFAGGLSYYLEIDSKQNDLSEAQTLLTNTRANVDNKRSTLDGSRTKLQALRQQIDSHTSLSDAKGSLTGQIASLETQKTDVLREFVTVVQKVRASSVGNPWPDVTLPNGQTLTGVTIQKVTDTDVSLAHSGGVTRVSVPDLPADLKTRFRYNMVPMVQPPQKPGAAQVAPASLRPPAPPVTVGKTESYEEKDARIKVFADKVSGMENQVASLEKTRTDWADKARQHRELGAYAQYRGRPSSTHFSNAAAADQQAAIISRQIDALHNEMNALRSKMR
jgi:hypothetical protein